MRNLSRLTSVFSSYFGATRINNFIQNSDKVKQCYHVKSRFNYSNQKNKYLFSGILSYLGLSGDNEVKDDPITTTVKSAILSIQVELVNIMLLEHHDNII